MWLAYVLAGGVSWTLAEYWIHRIWHVDKGKHNYSKEHIQHHAKKNSFTTVPEKMQTAAKVIVPMLPISMLILGVFGGAVYTASFLASYVIYDRIHYTEHVRGPRNAWERMLWKHHFYHHFHEPHMNHGVTSPIWDLVFGTYVSPGRVRVPSRLAMDWLAADGASEVHAEYASDYELRIRKGRAA